MSDDCPRGADSEKTPPAAASGDAARGSAWRRLARRAAAVCVAAAALGAASFAGGEARRWQAVSLPELRASSLEAAAGQGVLLGVFGGYRSIMADFAWLRSYVFWERQDRAACETYMRLAITLDPACIYFQRHAANRIAFDMPHWETRQLRRDGALTLHEGVVRQRARYYAERGLALHAEGAARNPLQQAPFWTDSALICSLRLGSPRRAAGYYLRAMECPNPAWYAPLAYEKILVEDLRDPAAAAAWLRAYLPRLSATPDSDPYGIRPELEKRLNALETGTRTPASAGKTEGE